jgi:septum formation protein
MAGGRLVLASASPRRAALLRAAGIDFEQGAPPEVDEAPPPGLDPPAVAQALAVRKAVAALGRHPGRVVLAADTVVFVEEQLLGKPADAADAHRMLALLSGREHGVATGVCVAEEDRHRSGVSVTLVRFRPLSGEEILDYVAGGEPFDKAGGYALQGGAARFVHTLEGDEDTVIGLPLRLVRALLAQ